jgi:hypothetical protein
MPKVTTWDYNAIALLKAAYSAPFGVKRLLDDPESTAAGFGFDLDPAFAPEIKRLNMAAFFATNTGADEELADFLHTTIVDGRYVLEWLADPRDVARKLGLTVTPAVIARITALHASLGVGHSLGITGRPPSRDIMAYICGLLLIVIASKGPEYRVAEPSYLDRF